MIDEWDSDLLDNDLLYARKIAPQDGVFCDVNITYFRVYSFIHPPSMFPVQTYNSLTRGPKWIAHISELFKLYCSIDYSSIGPWIKVRYHFLFTRDGIHKPR